jgi:WD40-like Beta Propeller Repeat
MTQALRVDVATGQVTTLYERYENGPPEPTQMTLADGRVITTAVGPLLPVRTDGFERDRKLRVHLGAALGEPARALVFSEDGVLVENSTGQAADDLSTRHNKCPYQQKCSPNGAWSIAITCPADSAGRPRPPTTILAVEGSNSRVLGAIDHVLCAPPQTDAFPRWDVNWSPTANWAVVSIPTETNGPVLRYVVGRAVMWDLPATATWSPSLDVLLTGVSESGPPNPRVGDLSLLWPDQRLEIPLPDAGVATWDASGTAVVWKPRGRAMGPWIAADPRTAVEVGRLLCDRFRTSHVRPGGVQCVAQPESPPAGLRLVRADHEVVIRQDRNEVLEPRWSPDGAFLMWMRRGVTTDQLEVLDTASGTPQAIGPSLSGGSEAAVYWSPDGTWILMIVPAPGRRVEPFPTYFGI